MPNNETISTEILDYAHVFGRLRCIEPLNIKDLQERKAAFQDLIQQFEAVRKVAIWEHITGENVIKEALTLKDMQGMNESVNAISVAFESEYPRTENIQYTATDRKHDNDYTTTDSHEQKASERAKAFDLMTRNDYFRLYSVGNNEFDTDFIQDIKLLKSGEISFYEFLEKHRPPPIYIDTKESDTERIKQKYKNDIQYYEPFYRNDLIDLMGIFEEAQKEKLRRFVMFHDEMDFNMRKAVSKWFKDHRSTKQVIAFFDTWCNGRKTVEMYHDECDDLNQKIQLLNLEKYTDGYGIEQYRCRKYAGVYEHDTVFKELNKGIENTDTLIRIEVFTQRITAAPTTEKQKYLLENEIKRCQRIDKEHNYQLESLRTRKLKALNKKLFEVQAVVTQSTNEPPTTTDSEKDKPKTKHLTIWQNIMLMKYDGSIEKCLHLSEEQAAWKISLHTSHNYMSVTKVLKEKWNDTQTLFEALKIKPFEVLKDGFSKHQKDLWCDVEYKRTQAYFKEKQDGAKGKAPRKAKKNTATN